jgi:hypothetical protein
MSKDKKETKGQTNKYGDVEFTEEQMEEFREAFLGNMCHYFWLILFFFFILY